MKAGTEPRDVVRAVLVTDHDALGPPSRSWTRSTPGRSGLVALLDELPRVVRDLEPALKGMAGVAGMVPELEEVADRMDNVGQIVEGVPGAKMLRRRGQRREAAEE